MKQNNIMTFFRILSGAHGIDSFLVLTHEIGKVLLPLLLRLAAVVIGVDAIFTFNLRMFLLAAVAWLIAAMFDRWFDLEKTPQ